MNRDETVQANTVETTSTLNQSTTTPSEESSAKRTRVTTEVAATDIKPKVIAEDDSNEWVKVHDPKTNKYYYWNKVCNSYIL